MAHTLFTETSATALPSKPKRRRKPAPRPNEKVVAARLPVALVARIDAEARAQRRSRSNMMGRLCEERLTQLAARE